MTDSKADRFLTRLNEVGFSGIFASPQQTECANCRVLQDQDVISEDIIPITNKLVEYLASSPGSDGLITDGTLRTIPNLEPEHVVPFLKEQFSWRMTDLRGELLSGREQEARLEVTVTSRTFEPPAPGSVMGFYGEYVEYREITQDKPGGKGYVAPSQEL